MGRFDNARVDRAAGGVVVRDAAVLVVHRPRYDDWSLPKGHVDRGESWAETARREVFEETGVDAQIAGDPMSIAYPLRHGDVAVTSPIIKVVVFYLMTPRGDEEARSNDPEEVDEVVWWPVADAMSSLSYVDERRVVAELTGL